MNIFSVLDTSDNEEETQKVVPVKKGKETDAKKESTQKPAAKTTDNKNKSENTSPNTNKGNKPANSDRPKTNPKTEEPVEGESSKDNNRGGRARGKEGSRYGEKPHREKQQNQTTTTTNEASQTEREGGERNHARRPKRDYERRSGTGRGKELSRGGRGPYGFGNVDQDALDAEKDPNTIDAAATEGQIQPEGEVVTDAAPETEVVPEPQPSVFTLDEYLQKREEARAKLAALNGDKQTRSVDTNNQFAGLVAKKDNLESYIEGKVSKTGGKSKEQRSTGKEQVLDVAFKVQTPSYEPRERRDGRDFRGGRGGRRFDRESKKSAPAAVFDSGDFPSL